MGNWDSNIFDEKTYWESAEVVERFDNGCSLQHNGSVGLTCHWRAGTPNGNKYFVTEQECREFIKNYN